MLRKTMRGAAPRRVGTDSRAFNNPRPKDFENKGFQNSLFLAPEKQHVESSRSWGPSRP